MILIVDDDAAIRRVMRRALEMHFMAPDIDEAADCEEAESRMALRRPKLLILDYEMPGRNGLELCVSIRQNPALNDIKIMMITGNAHRDVREEAAKKGVDAFLEKPFTIDEFLTMVGRFV